MVDLPTRIVAAETLRAFVGAIFRQAGCDADEAEGIAVRLVGANLTGHDSHGVMRVPSYIEAIEAGRVVIGRSVRVVSETAVTAVLDGQFGFGQTIGRQAVDLGIAKARTAGLATIALRHVAHLGRIGDWGERAADAGLISIHFVNLDSGAVVAPFGGIGRRFSTNPVCIAIPPLAGRPMLLLDMATAVVAEGKVRVASFGGKPVPEGALIGADGRPTTDPAMLYGPIVPGGPRSSAKGTGAIRAFGEHKGSALAFMCDILAGLLTGGGTAQPIEGVAPKYANGMLSIYLDPVHFGVQDLAQQAMEFAAYVKSSAPAEGVEEVLVPGEPEARNRATRADGIPVLVDTWQRLCDLAGRLGVAIPD